jgi:transcriptional regulator with XRE-family HTH domain
MPEMCSPAVRRRELGALLRALRTDRGMTIDHVAADLLCSPSKVSRMETGQRGAVARDVRDLCDLYEVADPDYQVRMTRLAAEGKQQGWWQSYDLDYATYVGLEEASVSISYFQSSIVPGLLQTPDYARAMHEGSFWQYTPERLDEHIEVRTRRQRVPRGDTALQVPVVLDEAVLHRKVGGPPFMGAQLDHLIEVSKLAHVKFQVIPFSAGAHPAMDNMFNILEFDGTASTVVYVEGLMGWLNSERPQDISRHLLSVRPPICHGMNPKESAVASGECSSIALYLLRNEKMPWRISSQRRR